MCCHQYCGIIFILGGQCLWVAKFFLLCGNSVDRKFKMTSMNIEQMLVYTVQSWEKNSWARVTSESHSNYDSTVTFQVQMTCHIAKYMGYTLWVTHCYKQQDSISFLKQNLQILFVSQFPTSIDITSTNISDTLR